MVVTLIGKNSLNKIILPNKPTGNYWLCDKSTEVEKKLVNIQSINDKWQIVSTNYSSIISKKSIEIVNNEIKITGKEKIMDAVILENYETYYIKLANKNEIYLLCCMPLYDNTFSHFDIINTTEIYIGSNKKTNHIVFNNAFIGENHVKIYHSNSLWMIESYYNNFDIYVNDIPVSNKSKMLYNGDVIFIFGLKIIIMGNSIFINNPSNKVRLNSNYFSLTTSDNQQILEKEDQEKNEESDEKYFLRPPRIMDLVDEQTITIEKPMDTKQEKELPIILAMASMLSMGAMTFITVIQTVDNFIHGQVTKKNAIFSLVASGIMILCSVLIPLLIQQYTTEQREKNKKDKIRNYKTYINNKIATIDKILQTSKNTLLNTYVSAEECMNIIINKTARLWERKLTDKDFITVRLGLGDIPSNIKIDTMQLKDETEEKEKEEQELQALMENSIQKAKILRDAPVLLNLTQKRVSALIVEDEDKKNVFMQDLLTQLVTFQSYDELKFVFLLKDNVNRNWDFVKMLPHTWNGSKTMRFFADNYAKIKEISQHLENEVRKRKDDEHFDYTAEIPYYLIIIDDYKIAENLNLINEILSAEKNIGFSIFIITNDINYLPNQCETFINLSDGNGILFETKNVADNQTKFRIDTSTILFFDKITPVLSNIPIKYVEEKSLLLPSSYTFLEMFNVGCIEQLNVLERWKKNDSTLSLATPLGIDSNGNKVELDIHEKYHGPHGLIGGSTGSGKSEFIITYILSLAVNYHPDDVTFVLIDYKGGGLAGAFKRLDVQLPHLVGTLTNIDKSGLQRSLESIESELKRRQIEFNEAKDITNESTMDIYKYQRLYHQGALKKPISHLFIISDEFAELKQQEPEFMDELVSIARIGRSLGVHLILATQKPAGVVNEQITSNTKFGICLKVQSPSDSSDIIGIPDGAKLKGSGQFYLRVGSNDYLVLGQAAWAGAQYYPSNEVKKEFDNSIEFISDTGMVLKKVDDEKKVLIEGQGEQITNIVKYLSDLAQKENIDKGQLWLEDIPETIFLDEIREKYHVKNKKYIINPVIGEYDNPLKQLQNVKTLNFSEDGNVIIYGNAESGKETLLGTIAYDIITNYTPEEVNLYILDFGSEAMKAFRKAPHVGEVIFVSEVEKITRFFMMLQKEIKERKEILSDYSGDYKLYLKSTGNAMPTYIVMLNNYETYIENYEMKFDELFQTLVREGEKCGIYFLVVASSTSCMRYRMLQNFKQSIALQMNNDDEYRSIFEHIGRKRPAKLFGRGLISIENEGIFEFQTAKICEASRWNEQIMNTIEILNKKSSYSAKKIPTVPEIVTPNHLKNAVIDVSAIPVGIVQKSIKPCKFDFRNNIMTIISTRDLEECANFISDFSELIKSIPKINFEVLDAENIEKENEEEIQKNFFEFVKNLMKAKKANREIPNSIIFIIGLGKMIEIVGEEWFTSGLSQVESLEKVNIIILDTPSQLEEYAYSQWYKKYVSNNFGIWIGSGIESQSIFKISDYNGISDNCGNTYGYVIKKGRPILVKILGMEEKKEEDE